jgi:hypothetical protein
MESRVEADVGKKSNLLFQSREDVCLADDEHSFHSSFRPNQKIVLFHPSRNHFSIITIHKTQS